MFSKLVGPLLISLLTPALLPADDTTFSRDLLDTVAARRALLEDKELGPLNLGVKVRGRIATLWGPVPSARMATRAIAVMQQLADVIAVRNEMEVAPADRAIFLPNGLPPGQPPPAAAPPGPPGILTNHAPGGMPRTSSQQDLTQWQPLQMSKRDPRMPDDREIDVVISALPVAAPPPEPPIVKTLPQAIQDLRRVARFSLIGLEMRGTTVYLRGDPDQAPAVYELARILSHTAGVQRVVLTAN